MWGWLTRSEHLSICGISSTKDQKAPQHLEIRFCHYDKSMFWPFMLSQTMNIDFLILLLWHSMLTDSIWIPIHLRKMLHQGPEGSSTPGTPVLPLRQVNVLAIYVATNHEYRDSDGIVLQCHAGLTEYIWTPFHLQNILHQRPEGSSTPGKLVLSLT